MVALFTASWDPHSKKASAELREDPEFLAATADLIRVRADGSKEGAMKYHAGFLPSLAILNSKGQVTARLALGGLSKREVLDRIRKLDRKRCGEAARGGDPGTSGGRR